MKKVGTCQSCGREVYTNDIDLCKKCNQAVGLEYAGAESAAPSAEENLTGEKEEIE
jgi:hypothetical protein